MQGRQGPRGPRGFPGPVGIGVKGEPGIPGLPGKPAFIRTEDGVFDPDLVSVFIRDVHYDEWLTIFWTWYSWATLNCLLHNSMYCNVLLSCGDAVITGISVKITEQAFVWLCRFVEGLAYQVWQLSLLRNLYVCHVCFNLFYF